MGLFDMTDLLTLAKQPATAQLPWLGAFRERALASWSERPFPTRRTEHWKYTPLQQLLKTDYQLAATNVATDVDTKQFIDVDAHRLVFIDGQFAADLSGELPHGVMLFSHADSTQQSVISSLLGTITAGDQHVFESLNAALCSEGIFIAVDAGVTLDKPIYVVNVATAANVLANVRILISLGKNATADVIEHFITQGDANDNFLNAITEAQLGDNAALNHYRINLEDEQAQHIGGVHVDLHRDARFRGFAIALGSKLMRVDYQMNHRGPGASLDLQGIYLPRHNQVVDYHTNVCHWVPHCTSNEVFRGIISDSAHAIFNGRIYIHQDAQKTLAELSNKNLLTSNKAEVSTKPELEIYADDVKCAHGATVSQLNKQARYYLQSRGLSRADADVMLSFGFINELLEQVQLPAVREHLQPRLAALFGRDDSLRMAHSVLGESDV
jgi:Fe-S cluster assembly protein SufD